MVSMGQESGSELAVFLCSGSPITAVEVSARTVIFPEAQWLLAELWL